MRSMRAQLAFLIASVALAAPSPSASVEIEDPFFGEALFYADQGLYFEALERLDAELAQHYGVDEPVLDKLHLHIDDAEFSVGDFELSYRMHLRAGRAIRAVLEGDVDEDVRARAALRLARIHYQKGQHAEALQVLDAMRTPLPGDIEAETGFLRANVLMALDRPAEAAEILTTLSGASQLEGYAAYNLGIALFEDAKVGEALRALDRAGRIRGGGRETLAIRDKSNLVLGTMLFEASEFERARAPLERVRLEGPFSNQALLRAGWSEVSGEHFDRAVVPWSILAERDPTDASVQEALLALPYAYSRLEVHGRAAHLYERAARSFGDEITRLDASIESVREGAFLRALAREEIRKDTDWVVRLRSLPDAPETFYLVSLMASHDFQTALQNYLDLEDLGRKLSGWRVSLRAFDEIVDIRRRFYDPKLPSIDREFRELDARYRLRLEQRDHLAERLEKMLIAPAPALLATSEERVLASRLDSIGEAIAGLESEEGAAAARERLSRLRGVLLFRQETGYHDRLTRVHEALRLLDGDLAKLAGTYESFVRVRQAASHGYEGYADPIAGLEARVASAIRRLEALRQRQGSMLELVATRELARRRERLVAYQNQARFAFADSYDRAAKAQAR
ncbi:MAG: hypothetical protein KC616_04025 [Myxococcales bacterium]|nr:hypothetical protein [Myxococcales bacterium]